MKKVIFGFGIILLVNACSNKNNIEKECCKKRDTLKLPAKSTASASIYQMEGHWTDQNGKPVILNELRGKIQVTAMIFSNCAYACPRIVEDIKEIEKKLSSGQKEEVQFLLISFDHERDTSSRLKAFSKEMGLNDKWRLLHGSAEDVREISLLLGVKYEKQTDGSFSHSNVISILDKNGAIVYQIEGLGSNNKEAMDVLSTLTK